MFDIKNDYESLQIDGVVCDKGDIFKLMIEHYLVAGRLEKDDYYTMGEIYLAVTDYVNSTHEIKFTYENMANIIFNMTEEERNQEIAILPNGNGVKFVVKHVLKNENDGTYEIILK